MSRQKTTRFIWILICLAVFALGFLQMSLLHASADGIETVELTIANSPFAPGNNTTKKMTGLSCVAGYSDYWMNVSSNYTIVSVNARDTKVISPRIPNATTIAFDARQKSFNTADFTANSTIVDIVLKEKSTGKSYQYAFPVQIMPHNGTSSYMERTLYVAENTNSVLVAELLYTDSQGKVHAYNFNAKEGMIFYYNSSTNYAITLYGGRQGGCTLNNFSVTGQTVTSSTNSICDGKAFYNSNTGKDEYSPTTTSFYKSVSAIANGIYQERLKEAITLFNEAGLRAGVLLANGGGFTEVRISSSPITNGTLTRQNSPFYPNITNGRNYGLTAVTGTAGVSKFWVCIDRSQDIKMVSSSSSNPSVVKCSDHKMANGTYYIELDATELKTGGDAVVTVNITYNDGEITYELPVRMIPSGGRSNSLAPVTVYIDSAIRTNMYAAILYAPDSNGVKPYADQVFSLREGEYLDYYNIYDYILEFFAGPSDATNYAIKSFDKTVNGKTETSLSLCNQKDGSQILDSNGNKDITLSEIYTTLKDDSNMKPYFSSIEAILSDMESKGMHAGMAYPRSSNSYVISVESFSIIPEVDIDVSFERDGITYQGYPDFLQEGDKLVFSTTISLPEGVGEDIFNYYKLVIQFNGQEIKLIDYVKGAGASSLKINEPIKTEYTVGNGLNNLSSSMVVSYSYNYGYSSGVQINNSSIKDYSNIKVVPKPANPIGYSNLTLNGQIGLNVYLRKLDCEAAFHQMKEINPGKNYRYYLSFKFESDFEPFVNYPIDLATIQAIREPGADCQDYYVFTLNLSPSQINENIKAFVSVLVDAEDGEDSYINYSQIKEISIKQYITYILDVSSSNGTLYYTNQQKVTDLSAAQGASWGASIKDYNKLCNMLAAMLNYGNAANNYEGLGNVTSLTADQLSLLSKGNAGIAGVTLEKLQEVPSLNESIKITGDDPSKIGVDLVGMSLDLSSDTAIRLYFKLQKDVLVDSVKFQHVVKSETGTLILISEFGSAEFDENYDMYFIRIGSITSPKLNDVYTVNMTFQPENSETKTVTLQLSALYYIQRACSSSDANLQKLATALYWYYSYCSEYFGV